MCEQRTNTSMICNYKRATDRFMKQVNLEAATLVDHRYRKPCKDYDQDQTITHSLAHTYSRFQVIDLPDV